MTANHPGWALEEAAAIERAARHRRLRRVTFAAATLAAALAAIGVAGSAEAASGSNDPPNPTGDDWWDEYGRECG